MESLTTYINGKLHVSKLLLVRSGVSANTLKWATSKGYSYLKPVKVAGFKAQFFEWESLKSEFKVSVQRFLGMTPDQYHFNANPEFFKPASEAEVSLFDKLKNELKNDPEAVTFFMQYQPTPGQYLTKDQQLKYVAAAQWINLCVEATGGQRRSTITIAKMQLSPAEFWDAIIEAINQLDIALPKSYSKLLAKRKQYQKEGYEALVSGRFGNKNNAKIAGTEMEKFILRLLSMPQNLGFNQVERLYNQEAEAQGWPEVSSSLIRKYYNQHKSLLIGSRAGYEAFVHHNEQQAKRSRPTGAGLFYSFDGWTAELYFRSEGFNAKGHKAKSIYNRLELMAVVDPFNDYIVGYSIGKETHNTTKLAFKNAVDHIKEITGKYFLFNQIQTDNFSSALKPWFEQVSRFYTPAAVGNSKGKPIESWFNRLNHEEFQLAPNWSGHNITSQKENQPNMKALARNSDTWPTVEQGYYQITEYVESFRSKRREEWINSLMEQIEAGKMIEIDRSQYLQLFTTKTEHKYELKPSGITVQITGQRYHFDLLDTNFKQLSHLKWHLFIDKEDMSSCMAESECGKYRFVLNEVYMQPMALMDRQEGDAEKLQEVLSLKKQQRELAAAKLTEIYEETEELIPHLANDRLKTALTVGNKDKKRIQKLKGVPELPPTQDTVEELDDDFMNIDWLAKGRESY